MTTQIQEPEASDLFFQAENSDKEYHLQLTQDEDENGWMVTAQWGRRGSELHDEIKIAGASFDDAKKLYDKTLNSKLKKGYQPER